ncbi:MAG TPA: NYN domain-containing protein [Patescibacteria group bacterium]|nr:NYN domain-containing protein [Patescibacteria group bacterium]
MNQGAKTVHAFIDSQNLNVGVQKFGWKMDWIKFRKFLAEKYNVSKAYMFIGYVPEFESLYEQLHSAGYMIVLKPTFDMTKPRQEDPKPEKGKAKKDDDDKKTKGNVDADLVLWAMKEMPNYHQAIIVSGDGDFYSLVEYLEKKKRLLKILAPNAHYSGLYNKYEKYVERLDTHRRDLAYHDRKKQSASARRSKPHH